jgi:glycosyltransferase involved in cell wall biosynthesis
MRETISISSGMVNEEKALPKFLMANSWVDEIIMCDAGCTDQSVEICKKHGARVYQMTFDGNHNTRANYVLSLAQTDWILATDPDEEVTEDLKNEILEVLENGTKHAAFEFKRINFFMDKPLRHGGWSGKGLRMYRRDKVRFEGDSYHDHAIIDGTIGQLKGEVLHYPSPTIHWILQKFNYISEFDMNEYFNKHGVASERQLKWIAITKPFKNFWKCYIKKQGYKDGLHGFIYAMMIWAFDVIRICKYAERYLIKNPYVHSIDELPDPWQCRKH